MTAIAILGAGTFAVEVLEAIELSGAYDADRVRRERARVLDRQVHCGLPVVTLDELLGRPRHSGDRGDRQHGPARVHRGGPRSRLSLCDRPPSVSNVSPRATIDAGTFLGAGAIVASNSRVHEHVVLNRGANVGHDVTIESFATVGPGVTIAGGVVIEAGVYVGVGAVIQNHVTIGTGAVIGAGAVVVKSVPSTVIVAGAPGRIVRKGVNGL